MFICNKNLFCLSFILISLLVMTSLSQAAANIDDRSILVWAEKDSQGKYTINLSRHQNGQWSEADVLFANSRQNILPTVSDDDQGNIWVAWTELHDVNGRIRFCFFINGQWSEPALLTTPTVSDMAPSLAIDADGGAWLVYSGGDGRQDDVYSVFWTGEAWSDPVKINRDDEFPDILPQVTIDEEGQPVVSWQGYTGRQYVTFISRWTGLGWSPEQELPTSGTDLRHNEKYLLTPSEQQKLVNSLPDFLTDTSQAVLYYSRHGKVETMKLNGLK